LVEGELDAQALGVECECSEVLSVVTSFSYLCWFVACLLDCGPPLPFIDQGVSHPDLRGKPGCVSYVRQRKTTHIMTKCIEINVTNNITKRKCLKK
jgi:hypothetical protein